MERFFAKAKEVFVSKDRVLPLSITDSAGQRLKKLLERPNPFLSEFIFFGLGKDGVIDTIVANDQPIYPGQGLKQVSSHVYISSAQEDDYQSLKEKLFNTGRFAELLVYGHTHPTGEFVLNGQKLIVHPDYSHLNPSSGSKYSGGLTSAHDLRAAKELAEKWIGDKPPHFGIAAQTQDGYKLRVFDTVDLSKVKRYSDIDKSKQITLDLT